MPARPRIAALSVIAIATIASALAAPQARSAEASTTKASTTTAVSTTAASSTTKASTGTGRTLYVNATSARCSDSGAGSRAVPFCAIQAAANVVKPGQVVEIEQSASKRLPFTRPVTFTRSGTPAKPIIVKGIAVGPDGLPELKAKPGITPVTFRHVHDITIESLGISYGGNANGVDVDRSSDITLNGVTLTGNVGRAGKAVKSAPLRVDDRSSAITLTRVAFHSSNIHPGNIPAGSTRAGDTRGQRGAAFAESFRLGEPPALSPAIGPAQRPAGIQSAYSSRGTASAPPPFGVFLFSPPTGAWCKPFNCFDAPFTFSVDWGDGTPATAGSANSWASHSYKSSGLYLVTITATGTDGSKQNFFTMGFEW